jgi:hypothetical protein
VGARAASSFNAIAMRRTPTPEALSSKILRTTAASSGRFPLDGLAPPVAADHLVVPVAEHDASGHLSSPRLLARASYVRLPRLLPFQLVSKGRNTMSSFEVQPHADAGLGELFERVGDFDLFAPEP